MKHLSHAELVDLIDDRFADAAVPDRLRRHVALCAACRTKADALRDVLATALADERAEPSPLFWEHFGTRVADAVRDITPDPGPEPAWLRFRGPVVATWTAIAAAVVLVILTVVSRETLHAPTAPVPVAAGTPAPRVAETVASPPADDVDADEAWAVVRTAAEGLAWDDAHAVGLAVHPGSAERVALELTADERSELARLLAGEIKRRGA